MDSNEVIEQYIKKMKHIHKNILRYLEDEEASKEDFQKLINYLDNYKIKEDSHKMKTILYMISKISDNHYRLPTFTEKIFQILRNYKNDIKKQISKEGIFNFFKENKLILLFLFEEKIIKPDKFIASSFQTDEYKNKFYPNFFINEFIPLFDEKYVQKINFENSKLFEHRDFFENKSDAFERKRRNGINDEQICQLIREDSVENFKTHLKRMHLPPSLVIKPNLFETNSFLIGKKVSLIEYAAFYGSYQIFKFLNENLIELIPSLWLFAIHGKNIQIIKYLESKSIQPPGGSFEICLNEAVKCHHTEIAKYIIQNLMQNNDLKNVCDICLQFYDFTNLPDSYDDAFDMFFYFCKYDYFTIFDSLVKIQDFNLDIKRILIASFFYPIFYLFLLTKHLCMLQLNKKM